MEAGAAKAPADLRNQSAAGAAEGFGGRWTSPAVNDWLTEPKCRASRSAERGRALGLARWAQRLARAAEGLLCLQAATWPSGGVCSCAQLWGGTGPFVPWI